MFSKRKYSKLTKSQPSVHKTRLLTIILESHLKMHLYTLLRPDHSVLTSQVSITLVPSTASGKVRGI